MAGRRARIARVDAVFIPRTGLRHATPHHPTPPRLSSPKCIPLAKPLLSWLHTRDAVLQEQSWYSIRPGLSLGWSLCAGDEAASQTTGNTWAAEDRNHGADCSSVLFRGYNGDPSINKTGGMTCLLSCNQPGRGSVRFESPGALVPWSTLHDDRDEQPSRQGRDFLHVPHLSQYRLNGQTARTQAPKLHCKPAQSHFGSL